MIFDSEGYQNKFIVMKKYFLRDGGEIAILVYEMVCYMIRE